MKKLLLLSLIGSGLLFGDYNSTTFKRAKENNQNNYNKSNSIRINGYIYNVREYRDYNEISIETKEHGRIRFKSKRRYKEGHKVSGSCFNEEYGYYKSCYLTQGKKIR